jgi:hypothetical protein
VAIAAARNPAGVLLPEIRTSLGREEEERRDRFEFEVQKK